MSAEDLGVALLGRCADFVTVEKAADLVDRGMATWLHDPQVPDVVGLVRTGTSTALVVCYLAEDDFEVSDQWDDLATCQWFARCGRPATTTQRHPILGEVPVCDRCQEFAGGAR